MCFYKSIFKVKKMSIIKYGTFIMYQNTETDEVVEVPLADEETLNKYANDRNWKEVGHPADEPSTEKEKDVKSSK